MKRPNIKVIRERCEKAKEHGSHVSYQAASATDIPTLINYIEAVEARERELLEALEYYAGSDAWGSFPGSDIRARIEWLDCDDKNYGGQFARATIAANRKAREG